MAITPKDLLKLQKIAQGGKRAATTAKDLEVIAKLQNLGEAPLAYTAADRARAGNKAAELIKTQPKVKASEALGQAMEKGYKKVSTTQSDRTRVGGDNIGGANFSAISEADPEYARKVWGVMDEGTASRLTNLSSPETIWTTMLGSANQLKTNPVVFDKLKKQFIAAMKEGKLSKELEAKFNHNLELTFGEGAQIRDPNIWKEADTFEKRAALADLMMGQGITPKKGGVAMGGEKSGKGVIFKPTDTLIQETEPSLLHPEHGGDAPTFALGPRLFNLSGTAEMRPDLHPGFPMLLHGEDLGYNFEPVPTEVFLPTWHKHFRDIKPERFQGPWAEEIINRRKNKSYKLKGAEGPGYYDLALGLEGEGWASQDLHDEFIRHLIREGYAEGGAVRMANGGAPRKYVPPSHLLPLKTEEPSTLGALSSAASNIKDAAKEEGKTYGDKGAVMDLVNRVPVANALGSFVDLANMPLQGLDYLASKIPAFSKPASVMEPEGERVSIAPVSSDEPYGGSEAWRKQFQKSGITSMTERPLTEMALSLALPFAPIAGAKALKAGKALAPTAGKLAEEFATKTQFGMPLELNVVPAAEGAGKAAEVKAPANDLGLYSVVEKAALNLQRKSGNGDAFLSDLMKNQGVSQAKLDETGMTAALKGRKGVTRDEVQQLAAEGKVPVQESVRRDVDNDELIQSLQSQNRTMEGGIENLKREILDNRDHPWNPARREKIETLKAEIEKNKNRIEESRPALFKPEDYPEYSTRGGDNYREIRIKLPKLADNDQNFYQTNHHGNEANVLAHMRVADHVDAEGKKGLLIDELQSDWHQKGRDRGYSDPKAQEKAQQKITALKEEHKRLGQLKEQASTQEEKSAIAQQRFDLMNQVQQLSKNANTGVPDAPFKEDWYQLGLKRAIKEATDTGMDRVYLTTGKTQADRYDLSKQVSKVEFIDNASGTGKFGGHLEGDPTVGTLRAYDKNGDLVISEENVDPSKLQDFIGKEAANKLITSKPYDVSSGSDVNGNRWRELGGQDLQVGGEGMRQYYDKTYLNWLKKYAKQHGAEVGMTELPNAARTRADLSAKQMHEMMDNPEFKQILDEEFGKGGNERNAWSAALKRFGGQKVYYLDLSPALKNTAKKGQAFAGGGAVQSANDFDYESHVNNIMNAHNAQNFDYEGHVNNILGMAEGGGLQNIESAEGLAPYGLRHSGEGAKGKGYFGMLPHEGGGSSTELSAEHPDIGEYPLLVPTLTREEIDHLLSGKKATDNIYFKAEEHAERRKKQGKSPFAHPDELRHPLPKKMADGGEADGGAAYNTNPDMSDGGLFVQAPAFKIGGHVQSIPR